MRETEHHVNWQIRDFWLLPLIRSKATTTCFSSGLGIWAVTLQTEVTPMQ
jgi:hypothetical protein